MPSCFWPFCLPANLNACVLACLSTYSLSTLLYLVSTYLLVCQSTYCTTCLRLSALYFLSCLAHGPIVACILLPVFYSIPFCLSAQWNTCLPACEPTKYLYLPAYCLPAFLPSLLPIPTTSWIPALLLAYLSSCLPLFMPTYIPAFLTTAYRPLPTCLSLYLQLYGISYRRYLRI